MKAQRKKVVVCFLSGKFNAFHGKIKEIHTFMRRATMREKEAEVKKNPRQREGERKHKNER